MKYLFSRLKELVFIRDGLYKGKWSGQHVTIFNPDDGKPMTTELTELRSSHNDVDCDIDIKQGVGTVTYKPKIDSDETAAK